MCEKPECLRQYARCAPCNADALPLSAVAPLPEQAASSSAVYVSLHMAAALPRCLAHAASPMLPRPRGAPLVAAALTSRAVARELRDALGRDAT